MAKKTVNIGANANDSSGDAVRTAFGKLNSNSDEMYSQLGADASGNLPTALPVSKGGTGTTSVEDLATSLETIGVGQSYQVVGEQRALDTTYTNTTGRAIFVCVLIYAKYNGGARLLCSVNGIPIIEDYRLSGDSTLSHRWITFIVPSGSSYKISMTGSVDSISLDRWSELR